ncbi:hypothetical protein [Accumulibacter sp.]|uniref:hypothetical protein n=1 Tax=Accumulibacter sp. TaxID=2053492 RepID=UPI0025E0339C|nr:hypothetical protein [Accumulibacter sp.]MCM8627641.1 hypothetical protein [Accumulibacter sp.]
MQPLDITRWRAADRLVWEPQVRRWLVAGVFPHGAGCPDRRCGWSREVLHAAAREAAAFDGLRANAPTRSGGTLAGHGVAIYVTAEDEAIEAQDRLNVLGPIPDRL